MEYTSVKQWPSKPCRICAVIFLGPIALFTAMALGVILGTIEHTKDMYGALKVAWKGV